MPSHWITDLNIRVDAATQEPAEVDLTWPLHRPFSLLPPGGLPCVVCAPCVSVLLHSRTGALSHLPDTAGLTPMRSHTGSHWSTAPCVPRCTISAFCVVPHCLVLCTTLHCVCAAALLLWAEGSGQCNALSRRMEAVGSGTPALHCRIAWGQWAVELLPYTAPLPWGSGPGISCIALPLCLEAMVRASHALLCLTAWRQWVLHTSTTHYLAAPGQWAVELLLNTASLPGGSGQWSFRSWCYALPVCLGAVGSGIPATHCLTAWGQWVVGSLQHTVSLPGGSGQWDPCNTLSHCLGAVGSGTPTTHRLTAWG